MRKSYQTAAVFILLLAVGAWAAEKVTFKTSVVEASQRDKRGSVSVTVIPAKGVHVSSGGAAMTMKITSPKEIKFTPSEIKDKKEFSSPRTFKFAYKLVKELKAPAKVKIKVDYVYCEEKRDTCSFGTKTLTVSIPKPARK